MNEINRPSQVIFIRHGESARNKAKAKGTTYFADEEARKTVKGIPDQEILLTPEGIVQAQQTGVYLRNHFGKPDYVYHSGYRRTIQTAKSALEAFSPEERKKIMVRMNLFIRERHPGFTYDMTTVEAEKAFPYLADHWKTFGGFLAEPPGGESLAQVTERAYAFLNMLFRDRSGKKIWVFTHGGTLRCFRFVLERWNYKRALKWPPGQTPENCGITVYNFDPKKGRLVLQEYNTVAWK